MNRRVCPQIMVSIAFLFSIPVCCMDTEVSRKKIKMTVNITTKSLVLGCTVNSYCCGDENRTKCRQLGWDYAPNDVLMEVAISHQDSGGKIIDCLKVNPPVLLKALLQASTNDASKISTLMHDLRTPQFPRYIPMRVLCSPEELVLKMHGCAIKTKIFVADGAEESNFSTSFNNTVYLATVGFGLTIMSCVWLLENMKLFSV